MTQLRNTIRDAMKAKKQDVDYSRGHTGSRCGICEFYHDHTCTKVQGEIHPDMWCRLFQLKGSEP